MSMGEEHRDGANEPDWRPAAKRRKLHHFEWRLYPLKRGFGFRKGDKVVVKYKNNESIRGTVSSLRSDADWQVDIDIEGKGSHQRFACKDRKRVVLLFENPTVVVTGETNHFRSMALQANSNDIALEIGCSTGETSKLIISNNVSSWVGFDTSDEMIEKCRQYACGLKHLVVKIDALVNPRKAEESARTFGDPTVVFVDIGGNREVINVFRMVSWILGSFQPRLVVVKSRELVQSLQATATVNPASGIISRGDEWFQHHQAKRAIPKHPLRAPLTLSPKDGVTPICRYRNYHKRGCLKRDCPFDHEHCHMCLRPGHIALDCPNT